jgi:CelD/BcsL family acetyltransferase involved in cellulose biosynthesis
VPLIVHLIRDLEGLDALEPSWNRLLAESGSDTPFLTHEWISLHGRHFAGRRRPLVLVLEADGEVAGIAPLGSVRHGRIRAVEFLGGYHADYQDFILRPDLRERGIRAFLSVLLRDAPAWDATDLRRIREDSPNRELLEHVARLRGAVRGRHDVSPRLEIRTRWDDYVAGLRKKLVKDTERQIRRLRALGPLRVRTAGAPDEVERLLSVYHRQKERRAYRDRVAMNSLGAPEGRAFLRDFSLRALKNGWLHMAALELEGGDEPLAISISLEYGNRFLYWLPSIDSDFGAYSPGKVLLYHLLQDGFARELDQFDFLSGPEAYKYLWRASDLGLHRVTLYRGTVRGRYWRAWREALRPRLRGSEALTRVVRQVRKRLKHGAGTT